MAKIIEFENISFSYPSAENGTIHNINLSIYKGECILLTGVSGCGKTTLLRLINKLIPDFFDGTLSGTVYVDGKSTLEYIPGEIAECIGNVFQDPSSQFFSTIVEDEIALVGENFGLHSSILKERVLAAAKICNVAELLKKDIHKLSGGQKQRVAAASTLVYESDIILMDEPSANLDYISTLQLRSLIKKLKSMGKTIIISEHRLFYLNDLFDRMIVMEKGEISNIFALLDTKILKMHDLNLRCLNEETLCAKQRMQDAPAVIEVENLTISRKKNVLLENVSFSLSCGEIMAVVGNNGIGKTTMAEILSGVEKVHTGLTSYGKNRKERRNAVYYVLQDPDMQLFFESVEKEMLMDSISSEDIECAKHYLRLLDLWEHRYDNPHNLSIGEKQRLVVAVGCMQRKKLLILDEPSAGLDFTSMTQVAEIIIEKSKECPIILITHDLELMNRVAHSVLLCTKDKVRKVPLQDNERLIMEHLAFFKRGAIEYVREY